MDIILISVKLLPSSAAGDLWMSLVVSRLDNAGREVRLLAQDLKTESLSPILHHQQKFNELYQDWGKSCRSGEITLRRDRGLTMPAHQIVNFSVADEEEKRKRCNVEHQQVIHSLNQWLDRSIPSHIVDALKDKVREMPGLPIRLVFELGSEDYPLQDLPWEKCADSNVIVRLSQDNRLIDPSISMGDVTGRRRGTLLSRVLILQGSNENINTDQDVNFIKAYLPFHSTYRIENQPSLAQFNQLLWDETWDAIFYLGHTNTHSTGRDGDIYINDREAVSIESMSKAFARAVDRGLQLIVFNSCAGMGLARQLSATLKSQQRHLPYIVVMRRAIGDSIAHEFIDRFARHVFRDGDSIERAMTQARDFLKPRDTSFPGADSLPILWCDSRALPLRLPQPSWMQRTGQTLLHIPGLRSPITIQLLGGHKMKIPPIMFLSIGLAVVVIIYGSRQPEVAASMGELHLFPQSSTPAKIAGMQAFGAKKYDEAIKEFHQSLQSQPHDPETRIYLNNALALQQEPDPQKLSIIPVISSAKDGYSTAIEILRGQALAQMDINQQGGIKGKKVILKIVLDNNDTQQAEKVARKLVQEPGIQGIAGHLNSNASEIAAPIYENSRMVMISASSSSMALKAQGTYTFRTVPNSDMLADGLAKHIVKTDNKKKLGICIDSTLSSGRAFQSSWIAAISKEGGSVLNIPCDISAPNFSAQSVLQKMVAQQVDGLLVYTHLDKNHGEGLVKTREIGQAANQRGISLYGPHALVAPEIIQPPSDFAGLVVVTPRHPDLPLAKKFATLVRQTFAIEPTWRDMTGYDAVKAIAVGLDQSDGTSRGLAQKLHDPNFVIPDGASGPIKFSQSGDRLVTPSIARVTCQLNQCKYALILNASLPAKDVLSPKN